MIKIKELNATEATGVVDQLYISQGNGITIRDEDVFFVAFLEDRVVGSVRFCIEDGVPLLRTMRVDKSVQRQKIGLKLLDAFQAYLESNNIRNTYCLPYSHLDRFYSHIGFKEIREQEIPLFLQKRLADYRSRNMEVLAMKRP